MHDLDSLESPLCIHNLFRNDMFPWELSLAKAERRCKQCNCSIKKNNFSFRLYERMYRPPYIIYKQCCLKCGLKKCLLLQKELDSFLSNFTVYRKEDKSAITTKIRPCISGEQRVRERTEIYV